MKGEAELKAAMMAIPQKIRDEVARELEVQAAKVVADMKRLVPVDTGALRDSIGWTWGNAPAGSVSIGTVKGRQFARMAITIYAGTRDKSLGERDAFYARFQEFGTVNMPANPFFYPAWRANKTRVKASLTRAVKRAVKRA
jgi:HK97 gp10 family phage protein